jgi:hypothetical protein
VNILRCGICEHLNVFRRCTIIRVVFTPFLLKILQSLLRLMNIQLEFGTRGPFNVYKIFLVINRHNYFESYLQLIKVLINEFLYFKVTLELFTVWVSPDNECFQDLMTQQFGYWTRRGSQVDTVFNSFSHFRLFFPWSNNGKVWDLTNNRLECIQRVAAHAQSVEALIVDDDSDNVFSASTDGIIKVRCFDK